MNQLTYLTAEIHSKLAYIILSGILLYKIKCYFYLLIKKNCFILFISSLLYKREYIILIA